MNKGFGFIGDTLPILTQGVEVYSYLTVTDGLKKVKALVIEVVDAASLDKLEANRVERLAREELEADVRANPHKYVIRTYHQDGNHDYALR